MQIYMGESQTNFGGITDTEKKSIYINITVS